ncbi:unnamed protein product [Parajaminaea phylloscopi]
MATVDVDGRTRGRWRHRLFGVPQADSSEQPAITLQPLGPSAQGEPAAAAATSSSLPPNVPSANNQGTAEQPAPSHPREASGRSFMSNISSGLREARERDRRSGFNAIMERVQQRALRRERDLEAGVVAPADEAARSAQGPIPGVTISGNVRMTKKDLKREKEEAATLFGPSLAHYFGSGSSTSGAVGGAAVQATLAQAAAAPTTPAAMPETPAAWNGPPPETPLSPDLPSPRAGRLGGRGRLREGSLSGLGTRWSGQSLANEWKKSGLSSATLPPTTVDTADGAEGASDPLRSAVEAVAVAEGIDIDILTAWIEKSLQSQPTPQTPTEDDEILANAANASSQCTVLQSYVNLKRNTINLMTGSSDIGVTATVSAQSNLHNADTELADEAPPSSLAANVVQSSDLRPAKSLSTMPVYGRAGDSIGAATTHNLHFEYDCMTPQASVQIFLRASRKHGSWESWISSQQEKGLEPSSCPEVADSLYYSHCPPPHALGWPVHSSIVPQGYGQALRASLALRLNLYAPPSYPTRKPVDPTAVASSGADDAAPEDAGPEDEGADVSVSPAPALQPIPLDETKEQRQAREKAERETLKLAIVVEALDGRGLPLAVPNVQVTYIRLTSLPVRPPRAVTEEPQTSEGASEIDSATATATATATPPVSVETIPQKQQRVWAAHVEGQEAEIGAHRFQLQELYGLSSRPPARHLEEPVGHPGGETEAADDPKEATMESGNAAALTAFDPDLETGECLICLSSPTTTLLLPCTHGLCLECSVQLKDSVKSQREADAARGKIPKKKWNCPMCRRQFTSMLHLARGHQEVFH